MENLSFRIGEQQKRKLIFGFEVGVGADRILGNADDDRAFLFKVFKMVPVTAGLFCTARRIVFRIKIQNDFLSSIARERVQISILIRQREIRSRCSGVSMI